MNHLTITNPKGATVRTAPNTSGGEVRRVPAGTVFDYQYPVPLQNGDIWALLAQIDPTTGKPWRDRNGELAVFVAVYVGGVEYGKLTPDTNGGTINDGYKAAVRDMIAHLEGLLK